MSIRPVFIFLAVWAYLLYPATMAAQSIHDPRALGLGGNGVSISTGIFAATSNPANLMVYERAQRWNIVIAQGGFHHRYGFEQSFISDPMRYMDVFTYQATSEPFPTTGDLNVLLDRWFRNDAVVSTISQEADLITAGISYTGVNFGLALFHRVRGNSTTQLGRGWYDDALKNTPGFSGRNQSIRQNYFVRQEIGVSVAWEYDLVSGWLSELSRIYIGFTPKIVLPVTFYEHNFNSLTHRGEETGSRVTYNSYDGVSAGFSSDVFRRQIASIRGGNMTSISLDWNDLQSSAGLGAGFDAGITYIIGLESDMSLTTRNRIPTRYSLRFAASVNDIGFVSFNSRVARWSAEEWTATGGENYSANRSQPEYSGRPDQFYEFINRADDNSLADRISEGDDSPLRRLLPAQANAGIALHLNRFMIAGAIRYPLEVWGNEERNTSFHAGTELRILRFLPLRAGIILEADSPTLYSIGSGLDFGTIVISATTTARTRRSFSELVPVTATFGTMMIRF